MVLNINLTKKPVEFDTFLYCTQLESSNNRESCGHNIEHGSTCSAKRFDVLGKTHSKGVVSQTRDIYLLGYCT